MAMSTGAKVALGCGIVAFLGMIVAVVTIGVGAFWLKGKAEEVTGGSLEDLARKAEEMAKWETEANANAFTAPADGVIAESRLLKFLDVRKQVHAIYVEHEEEIETFAARTKDEKDLSVSEAIEGAGRLARLATDVRLAQMKALAGVGMSEAEYRYIQVAVYQSAWASELEKGQGAPGAESATNAMDAPSSNVELFRRHEAEIKKYAMGGLAIIGL